LPLANMPVGTFIHNIEMVAGKGGQFARSAGAVAQLLAKEGDYAHIRMSSGEIRLVSLKCMATIGQVGNIDHENVTLGSAGRSRHMGIRPTVRGTAMNAVDHPHVADAENPRETISREAPGISRLRVIKQDPRRYGTG